MSAAAAPAPVPRRENRRRDPEAECRLRRHDGAYRWLLAKGAPLFADDRLHGFYGVTPYWKAALRYP